MAVAFREVLPYAGVDEHTPTGGAGIIVPHKGVNVVMLDGGPDLKVVSSQERMIAVDEIHNPRYFTALAYYLYPFSAVDNAYTSAMLKTAILRVFKITGHSLVGVDLGKVRAINRKTSRVEATLKVIVLKQRLVKVAIRPVQVLDDQGRTVDFSGGRSDAQGLLDQMNQIWTRQANVVFKLMRTDPVLLDRTLLKPESEGADIQRADLQQAFKDSKDPNADLTMFLVKKALDGRDVVNGVTDAPAGISLVSDFRSEDTMAHEAGHFLGAVDEHGKFSQVYGHQGTDPDLLMRAGGGGKKIPFGLATDFNKGYQRK